MKKTKFLVVGWDGADWKVINRLVEQGKMPTMARLIDNGTIGNIATLDPPFSPMLWTTIATGKYPFKHGILGFSEPRADMNGIQPISSLSRKTKAVWNILTQNDYFCNVVNWWPSHPAEPINGFMISNFYKAIDDFQFHPLPQGTVHPSEFTEFFNYLRLLVPEISGQMLLPLVPQARDIEQKHARRLYLIAKNLATTLSVHNAATWLAENTSWDFMAVYYDLIDHLSHGFMQYYPPRLPHISPEEYKYFNQVVEGGYILQDYMLGYLLEQAGEDTNLILLSDHGFHSDHLRPRTVPAEPAGPAYEHRPYGILLMHGPLFKKDERIYGASLLDITPTILYAYNLPVGEDMDGVPLINAFRQPTEIKTIPSWEQVPGQDGRHKNNYSQSNYDQAEILQQLIDLGYIEKPDDNAFRAAQKTQSELNYNLARSYMFAHHYDKARPILEDLFYQYPYQARFAARLIKCYQILNEKDKIHTVIEKFKEKAKEHEALLMEKQKELNEKLSSYKDKNQDLPKHLQEEVHNLIRQISGIKKDKVIMEIAEADLFMEQNQLDKAINILSSVLKKARPTPELLIRLANVYILKENLSEAEKILNQALELDPENNLVLYKLGYVAYLQQNYSLALEYFLESLSLFYYNYQAHYLLALTFYNLADYEHAAMSLEVVLKIAPNFAKARNLLINIYEKYINDKEKAEKHRQYFSAPQEFVSTQQTDIISEPEDLRIKPGKKTLFNDIHRSTIIVVSGIPRSGTSLMMQMIQKAGLELYTDGKRESDENNPRGYYEHEDVKKLPQSSDFLYHLNGKAVKIVSHLLPYLPDTYNYKVIFMLRDMDEIVRSQLKMIEKIKGQSKTYRYFSVKNQLTLHLHRIRQWLQQKNNFQVLFLSYNELIKNPEIYCKKITDFLNIKTEKIPEMISAIDNLLYRTKKI